MGQALVRDYGAPKIYIILYMKVPYMILHNTIIDINFSSGSVV